MCSENNAEIIQIRIILGGVLTDEPVFYEKSFNFSSELECNCLALTYVVHLRNGQLFHTNVSSFNI